MRLYDNKGVNVTIFNSYTIDKLILPLACLGCKAGYDEIMKVWRGISLGLWTLFFAVLLTVSSIYFIVFQTVMNQAAMTERLRDAGVYRALRDTVLVPLAVTFIGEKAQFTPLLTREMTERSVRSAFTDQKMNSIGQEVAPAVYAWLDKKSPDISFAVPIRKELEAAQQDLAGQIEARLKALPTCAYYYVDAGTVTRAECLPQYATVPEVLRETMASVDEAAAEAPTELTPETTGLSRAQLGKAINIPDYLSYLWAVTFITVPLTALTGIYLIVRRGSAGLLAVGIVLASFALVLAGGAGLLGSLPLPDQALAGSIASAVYPLVGEKLLLLAYIGGGSGMIAITSGIIWRRARKRRRQLSPIDEYAKTP